LSQALSFQGLGFAGFVDDERIGAAHLDTDAAGTEHELDYCGILALRYETFLRVGFQYVACR
jgi:hypothetical protein